MSSNSRKLLIGLGAALILVAGLLVWAASSPLRQSEAALTVQLLQEAPLGSSVPEVEAMIRHHGWELSYPLADSGFLDQRVKPARKVGDLHLRANLGDYWSIPWMANVTAFWGFTAEGHLVDVWVWKTWDAP